MLNPETGIVFVAILLAVVALTGGLIYQARRQRANALFAQSLTDDMVRQIEEAGYVDVDEPLDIQEIQEEEERFWEEAPWEEPDEF
ncbi:MAG TPA: hypothetical protein VHG09_06970 [Longimicrobiales bacterium]|nr:hypothetical protein [Longimicrobiales bacterium]